MPYLTPTLALLNLGYKKLRLTESPARVRDPVGCFEFKLSGQRLGTAALQNSGTQGAEASIGSEAQSMTKRQRSVPQGPRTRETETSVKSGPEGPVRGLRVRPVRHRGGFVGNR